MRNHFPDVVVVNFGMAECQPRVVPTWLVRHFTTWDRSSAEMARWYRRELAPPLWTAVRRWQQVGSGRIGSRTARLAPARFAAEIRRIVEMVRAEARPLVLVLDIDPPGPRIVHWLPGIDARVDHYNTVLAGVVRDLGDEEVRFVRSSAIVRELGFDVALPDGLHRSAVGHRRTAELLAAEVRDWLGTVRR
ncbi:MAG: hypothetical protein ACR2K2_12680 [Mycobacteriales bacterium]